MGDADSEIEFLNRRERESQRKRAIALGNTLKGILGKDISFEFEASDGRPEGVDPDYISFRKENRELARLYWFGDPMALNVYAKDFVDYADEIQERLECKVDYAGGF